MTSKARLGSGAMFDGIAQDYDRMNRIISLGLDRGWRRKLAKALDRDEAAYILDVATGTGDVAIEIAQSSPRSRVTGIDPSVNMLAEGNKKLEHLGLTERVQLLEGDAQALPFDDNTFDASVISFGIRNVPDRRLGLSEMVRVTQAGGRIVVLELNEPRGGVVGFAARMHVHHMVPLLGAWLSSSDEYKYLQQSIAVFPEPKEFAAMMEQAGIRDIEMQRLGFGAATLFIGEVQ